MTGVWIDRGGAGLEDPRHEVRPDVTISSLDEIVGLYHGRTVVA
jgi:FMN phosphatase YigB (HAD superfamily)